MIIFMGVAGSGKSSQGRQIADEYGLPWLSTGEFLRMLIAGKRRKDMVAGKLLKDEEIIALVQKILTVINKDEEFVLDGFPRTTGQADWLLSQAKYGQLKLTAVIQLEATEEEVSQRLMQRGRPDDTETAIRARFNEYEREIVPILDHFRQAGVPILDIDGGQSMEDVHRDIDKALKSLVRPS